eukprot:SAG22_NODE_15_length_32914_cov_20.713546_5_plen_312_part_00
MMFGCAGRCEAVMSAVMQLLLSWVAVAAVGIGVLLVLLDLWHYGLGTANGRFVSFLDSLNSCYEYRSQNPLAAADPADDDPPPLRRTESQYNLQSSHNSLAGRLRILCVNFVLKFASSTTTSALLWKIPVVLKGPRHLMSFLLSLVLVQGSPADRVFIALRDMPSVQLLLGSGCALYKLRKLLWALQKGADYGWGLTLVLAFTVVEGNSFARRAENVLSNQGCPRKLSTWVGGGKWIAGRLWKLLAVTLLLAAWERHGFVLVISAKADDRLAGWFQLALRFLALWWYFGERYSLAARAAAVIKAWQHNHSD